MSCVLDVRGVGKEHPAWLVHLLYGGYADYVKNGMAGLCCDAHLYDPATVDARLMHMYAEVLHHAA
eukprot:11953594-Karenia_brevis.AAC.1